MKHARPWLPSTGAILAVALSPAPAAQGQSAPVNGIRPADLRAHAIVGARVVTAPGEAIDPATLVMADGVIVAVGAEVSAPPGARIWPGEGLTVYPGLIDAAVLVEAPPEPPGAGDHWNGRVHPQLDLAQRNVPDATLRETLRKLGFAAAAVYPAKGVFRGSGVLVALSEEDRHALAYGGRRPLAMGFDYGGSWGSATYPGSLMGAMALVRQTLADARWHAECRRVYREHPEGHEPPIRADALAALAGAIDGRQPVLFEVSDEHTLLRAARLGAEHGLDMHVLGSGTEFRRLAEVVATGLPVVAPLTFPERPDLTSIPAADRVTLRDMMSWEQAPTNPRRLAEAGVALALTTHGLESRRDFYEKLHEAMRHGLSEEAALAALTTTPARLLGVDAVLGTIAPGKTANLLVVEGSLFERKPEIRDVWINGRRHEVEAPPAMALAGRGTLRTDLGVERPVTIDTEKKSVAVERDGESTRARKVLVQRDQLSFVLDGRPFDADGYVRLSGVLSDGAVTGSGELPDGRPFAFTIEMEPEPEPEPADALAGGEKPPADDDGGDDGLSGEWAVTVSGGDLPREFTFKLELERHEGGGVTGRVHAFGREIELESGRFDAGAGTLEATWSGPGGGTTEIEATLRDGGLSGAFRGRRFAGDLAATRTWSAGDEDRFQMPPEKLVTPLGAYGLDGPPPRRNVLVSGATIWTGGPRGILENADLLVIDGRVERIGAGLRDGLPDDVARSLLVIDGAGRHVTPGLIDCHSHTGIDGGVNEWTQTNTAEVRIGDVIDPDDVNWYRQLAGGLTACNQLHGSANPIGGQNSVVKLKWGSPAADFPIAGAIGGIKFALGENVKRSENRYPDTRMGVETFIRDAFTAAADYRDARARYEGLPTEVRARTMPPRPDLELDALVEIIEGRRLVHCHSYRQDEILMLIRVAEAFGFTIGTFQHVLEGYKVAEAIAAHGAGGSSFSDWWAYKMEVMDAIPHNGTLMTRVGVVTSFNSDSSELARRMNTEAAKAVRYGGLDPHEALRLVTLNPARQLQVDDRIGSLEPGKDGDFVIWSGSPLSTYSRCEETWIEGARYFSLEDDRARREAAARERQRLTQKILADAHGEPATLVEAGPDEAERPASRPGAPASGRRPSLLLRMVDARRSWMEEQVRLGADPDEIRPGRCACNDVWWRLTMMGRMAQEN